MRHIEPFHVMELMARARKIEAQGNSVLHMEIGEPDFSTPEPIMAAGVEAMRKGNTHYTPAAGLFRLRESISGYYRDRYRIEIDPQRIILTPGASGALVLLLGVLVDAQDKVLMADPGYPCNRHFLRLYEGQPVSVPVDAETAYQLTPEHLHRHWSKDCVGVLVASPSNPTGTVIPPHDLQAMADICARKKAVLIVDEIYHGLNYDDTVETALKFGGNVFVINSFSKFFGMTGWRLGWLVAPLDYVRDIEKLAQNIFLAAATPSQYAAMAAFRAQTMEILEARRETFRQRRDFLLPALRALGFDIPMSPQGAFYLYANCAKFTDDSFVFANKLLTEAGVAVTPGLDFGCYRAEQHVRFAYTTAMASLEEGVERIERFLKNY